MPPPLRRLVPAALLTASLLAAPAAGAKRRAAAPEAPAAPAVEAKPSPAPASEARAPNGQGALFIERVGVSLDLFFEPSRMGGEQWINNFRADESFDYGAGPLAATLYLLVQPSRHLRFGPGGKFLGNYGNGPYTFGYLGELFLLGEFSMRAFEQVDAVLGGRLGASLLVPGEQLRDEIRRLQAQNAGVWDVPRLGWVAGVNVGARRKLAGSLYGRLDLHGSLGHHFLFRTDQIVDGLRFRKRWGNDVRRLGLALGIELGL